MSETVKPPSVTHPLVARGNLYRAAIVGAASLKGKEVAEMLNERNFPAADVRLLDDDESMGQLEAMGDEISFIQRVRAEQFEHVDFTFYASDQDSTRKSWKDARDAGSTIIDLSAALENEPGAKVRSLWIERERGQVAPPELQPGPCVTAHPISVALALLLLRARKAAAIRRVVATIFEPASEHGQRGMDELHQQTVNLLSFQPLPKDVFDVQVAFNMVARYGQQAQPTLDSVEARVLRHYRKIAGDDAPQPSLLLLQSPIFHAYALAVFLELDSAADLSVLSQALAGDHVAIPGADEDSPSNVSAAGQPDVQLWLKGDAVQPNGVWLWASADNLRIAALTAVECAESLGRSTADGKDPMRSSRWLVLAPMILLLAGCGYHTAGHVVQLPESVKTIAVPAFKNETTTYRIEQMLTSSVVRELTTRTHYRIVNDPGNDADATLVGTVLSTSTSPLAYDTATGRAASVMVVVSMRVTLADRSGKVLYQNPAYLFREQYEVSQDLASFFEEDSPAFRRLSQDFARTLVSNILEGF